MQNQFIVKAKYTTALENGTFKRVNHPYLLHAMSFSDAETSIYKNLGEIVRGEFTVMSITRAEYHDLVLNEMTNIFYDVTITFEATTDDSAKTKKTTQKLLVEAESTKDADEKTKEFLNGMMVDFKITSIKETAIQDIFDFLETPTESDYQSTEETVDNLY